MVPTLAISPQSRLQNLRVIYTSPDKNWSLALLDWLDENGRFNNPQDWNRDCLGCRWNGDINDPADQGHPRSHGHGTWFILPDPLADLIRIIIQHDLLKLVPKLIALFK